MLMILSLLLYSGITPDGAYNSYGMLGIKLRSAGCKIGALPAV